MGFHNVVINGAIAEKSKGFVNVEMGFGTADGVGKDFVESEIVIDGNVGKGDDDLKVVMSENEISEGGGRYSDPKGVSLVVDLNACVQKDKESGKKKGEFCVNDLVWAKVRSHPWWPGQIFDPVDASDVARKWFRSKSHLVAYFGDHSFAWNDEVNLKPFVPHFTKLVKQTNKESFQHAVDCVLDEVSRRVEFGLSCGCIKDDVYNRLKTQVIDNAGIRELSSKRECGDRFLTVSSFEPLKFLNYVKGLAQEPFTEVERLEFVIAKGQMSSLYRWKGCYDLVEFDSLIGHLSNEADLKYPIIEKEATCEMSDGEMVSPQGENEENGTQTVKRKNIGGGSRRSSKKVKRVSDLMVKGSKKQDNENEIVGNIVNMSSSKEKAFDSKITTISKCGDLKQVNYTDKIVDVAISTGDDFPVLLETKCAPLSSEPSTGSESVASESGQRDEKSQENESPTALTLKFTDIDSIPSKLHLNKIFSQFGPLKESETEVLTKKNCARVVFKRRVDADSAFSSSGKFETFGPSLVCYQLNYAPSPRKPLSVEAKQRKKR